MDAITEWWEDPAADPHRPMLPEQAVRFLQMAPPAHPNAVRTILRWARNGRIKKIHVGKEVRFTLAILRDYAGREVAGSHPRKAG
jgi:hypothetical protein